MSWRTMSFTKTAPTAACLLGIAAAAAAQTPISTGLTDAGGSSVAIRNSRAVVAWTDNGAALPGNPDGDFETAAARLTIGANGTLIVGPNLNLSHAAGPQRSNSVAINRANPNQVVVVGSDGNDDGLGGQLFVAVSTDGGQSFSTRTTGARAIAPEVAFDAFGNCFIGYLDGTLDPFNLQARLLASSDSCVTLAQVADGGSAFSVSLAAGPHGAALAFNSYAAGLRLLTLPVNGLGSFGAVTTRDVATTGRDPDVAIGPDGRIAVTYNAAAFVSQIDTDGFGPQGFGPVLTLTDEKSCGHATAFDRSSGVHRGRLYTVYATCGNASAIALRFSDDGFTISTATALSDGSPRHRSGVAVDVDSDTGTLMATWVRTEVDPASPGRSRFRVVGRALPAPIAAGPLPNSAINFRAGSAIPGRVELSWTDRANNETGYRIRRFLAEDPTFEPATIVVAANTTTFLDTTLPPLNRALFVYDLTAFNAAGDAVDTSSIAVTTLAIPAAPGNTVATAISSSQIRVTWQDNSPDDLGFVVERSTNGVDFIALNLTPQFATTFVDSNLPAATTFFYRVRATNFEARSAASNVSSATTQGPNGPLAALTSLTAKAASGREVTLRWVVSSNDAADIEIQRSTDGTRFDTIARTGSGFVTVFFDRTVTPRRTLFYRVRAVNGSRVSAFSNVATVTTPRR